jgi:DNA mismatch repair protein MutS2
MPASPSRWTVDNFAHDLFLSALVKQCFELRIDGIRLRGHPAYIERVLAQPPATPDAIRFRQEILRELEDDASQRTAVETLLVSISELLALLRASRDDARLEPVRFRLDVLRSLRDAIDQMGDSFSHARSGLSRLSDFAATIRESTAFKRLVALLDHDSSMASLTLEATIGADGRLRHIEIRSLRERRRNIFFRRPLRRWWDRLRIAYHRYNLGAEELVDRLVMGVYGEIAPAMARVVQVVCPLELYVAAMGFADDARSHGLEVCLPDIDGGSPPVLERLFNPLLLALTDRPVPSDISLDSTTPTVLVTGPNSGGKTRLLQAVGIAQVLAQNGLFAPCARARLAAVPDLFASIIEVDQAFQSEGRLGTELVRLRTLFTTVPSGSLVLLDELCSGTNPSEAIEIVDMVLRLLDRLRPVAFVTTHFLDFAHQLRREQAERGCHFLHVEVDGDGAATYRFVPGVATTSLAAGTARRLGVTFEEIERQLEEREEEPGGE